MKQAEISAALAARGIHLDPMSESFMDAERPLDFDEVCALLPDATDDEIAAWAEAEAVRQRRGYRHIAVQLLVPEVSPETVAAAKRMAAKHPADSDEHKLAVLLIDLADELDTLGADMRRASGS